MTPDLLRKYFRTAFRIAASPGTFAVGNVVQLPLPSLVVDGVGRLLLPLESLQLLSLLSVASPAPCGKGMQKIVDVSVRNAFQVDRESLHVGAAFRQAVESVVSDSFLVSLGLESLKKHIRAELCKLIIYPEGGFFRVHRDTEKEAGTFATLVIQLPSRFSGGELVIEHGNQRKVFDFSHQSDELFYAAAFYTDCKHEVKEVASGNRVCLLYSLINNFSLEKPTYGLQCSVMMTTANRRNAQKNTDRTPLLTADSRVQSFLLRAADVWETAYEMRSLTSSPETCSTDSLDPPAVNPACPKGLCSNLQITRDVKRMWPRKLVHILEHRYTEDSLWFSKLKGTDAEVAGALRCSGKYELYLVLIEKREFKTMKKAKDESLRKVEQGHSSIAVLKWVDCGLAGEEEQQIYMPSTWLNVSMQTKKKDGKEKPATDENRVLSTGASTSESGVKNSELMDVNDTVFKHTDKPDKNNVEENTRNRVSSAEYIYHKGLIVFWPRSRTPDVIINESPVASLRVIQRLCARGDIGMASRLLRDVLRIVERRIGERRLVANADMGVAKTSGERAHEVYGDWHNGANPYQRGRVDREASVERTLVYRERAKVGSDVPVNERLADLLDAACRVVRLDRQPLFDVLHLMTRDGVGIGSKRHTRAIIVAGKLLHVWVSRCRYVDVDGDDNDGEDGEGDNRRKRIALEGNQTSRTCRARSACTGLNMNITVNGHNGFAPPGGNGRNRQTAFAAQKKAFVIDGADDDDWYRTKKQFQSAVLSAVRYTPRDNQLMCVHLALSLRGRASECCRKDNHRDECADLYYGLNSFAGQVASLCAQRILERLPETEIRIFDLLHGLNNETIRGCVNLLFLFGSCASQRDLLVTLSSQNIHSHDLPRVFVVLSAVQHISMGCFDISAKNSIGTNTNRGLAIEQQQSHATNVSINHAKCAFLRICSAYVEKVRIILSEGQRGQTQNLESTIQVSMLPYVQHTWEFLLDTIVTVQLSESKLFEQQVDDTTSTCISECAELLLQSLSLTIVECAPLPVFMDGLIRTCRKYPIYMMKRLEGVRQVVSKRVMQLSYPKPCLNPSSWRRPQATEVEGHPMVTDFLRSEQQWMRYGGVFIGIKDARTFAKMVNNWNGLGNPSNGWGSIDATAHGTGRYAFVDLFKTQIGEVARVQVAVNEWEKHQNLITTLRDTFLIDC